ncbi:MAG: endonuclease domain-containing protein [Ruminococcaceae bacterium]|nr:endonuclease domain-containing protein [Oscillospiraceae bacterium]
MKPYDHYNVANARRLRKEMTPWERRLWYCFLRSYPIRFQRQKCIDHYIADFYCFQAKLVIELDGGGHYEPDAQRKDAARTRDLEKCGLKVLRICNLDIDRNFEGVCTFIDMEVKKRIADA